jgi:hypothetical protein
MVAMALLGFVRQHPVHGPGTSAPAFEIFRKICRRQAPERIGDRGRTNAGETAEGIDLAASGLAPRYICMASPGDCRCRI